MRMNKAQRAKMLRFGIWGAIIVGIMGFVSGMGVCLYFKLPIPPIFITEIGVIIGGCLGALCAVTNSEKRVVPTLIVVSLATTLGLFLSVSWKLLAATVALLGIATWSLAEPPEQEQRNWKSL